MPAVDTFTANPGHCPPEALGKRVNVRLRNGRVCEGWMADGKGGCPWSMPGNDHDIVAYELAG